MKHQLTIEVKNLSVAVERFLRVTRHRGFELVKLDLQSQGERFLVNMEVDSDKPLYLLTQQLNKLVDVASVEVKARTANSGAAAC
jgi:acetolactate synthase II small subunit